MASSRQLRRLDSTTRSPVYSNFGETVQGLSSIRAYNVQQRFIDISDRLLDRNQSCYYASGIANRLDMSLFVLNKIFDIETNARVLYFIVKKFFLLDGLVFVLKLLLMH